VSPSLAVVICSRDGAEGVERCLAALRAQTVFSALQLIVVDDGSADNTGEVARRGGATVVRHATSRGASAARNSGIKVAAAPIVAFLDDDCEPLPDWAQKLLAAYGSKELAVGGSLLVAPGSGIIHGYLSRNNPLAPQELELARSTKVRYRFSLYLRRQWMPSPRAGRRAVATMPTANLSVRRQALLQVGGFDERIRFGSEDEDLCHRLALRFPDMCLLYEPAARVTHYFQPSLRDAIRRSRAYGTGSALMYRKWPDVPPTIFPFPIVELAVLVLSWRFPMLIAAALLLPHAFYPKGLLTAFAKRQLGCVIDAYLQMVFEASDTYGFAEGWWRFRYFAAPVPAALGARSGATSDVGEERRGASEA
jgi:glycosyltransferase involved in cell wall biosynthesis